MRLWLRNSLCFVYLCESFTYDSLCTFNCCHTFLQLTTSSSSVTLPLPPPTLLLHPSHHFWHHNTTSTSPISSHLLDCVHSDPQLKTLHNHVSRPKSSCPEKGHSVMVPWDIGWSG
jgi:hypothetical protein